MIATVLSMSGLSDSLIWDLQTAHAATLSASPSTVPGGGIATATVTGGPGGTGDFVGLYALGAPNWSVFNYLFLNDSTVPSATGLTSGTLHFTMPSIPGTYEFRLFPGTFDTALATSNPITVPSAVPVSLSADPSSITLGDISMLAWGSSNATSCTGANFTPTGVAGKVTVIPSTTTTYSVTCTGPQGSYSTSTTVSVSPVITTPIINFVASQTSITSGLSSTLAWHATNATSCSGSGFSTGGLTLGSVTVTPSANTTYSVTCTGSNGSATATVTVTIDTAAPTINATNFAGGHAGTAADPYPLSAVANAINSLPATGGTVILANGIWAATSTVTVTRGKFNLVGASQKRALFSAV